MAKSGIQCANIRHRVTFRPDADPENPTWQLVTTRRVNDLISIRKDATHLRFDDVVELKLWVEDLSNPGQMKTIFLNSPPFNESGEYEIIRDETEAKRRLADPSSLWTSIDVHPSLRGSLWVFCYGTQKDRLAA